MKSGDLTVEISYMVSGAGWEPLYDIRLLEKDGISSFGDRLSGSGDPEHWRELGSGPITLLHCPSSFLARILPELEPGYIRHQVIPMPRPAVAPAAMAMPRRGTSTFAPQTKPYRETRLEEEVLKK